MNKVIRLEDSGLRWFAVLLLRSAGSGYVLTGTQVRHRINDGLFKLSGDGDHKVNEPDLRPAQTFARLEDLLDRVL